MGNVALNHEKRRFGYPIGTQRDAGGLLNRLLEEPVEEVGHLEPWKMSPLLAPESMRVVAFVL